MHGRLRSRGIFGAGKAQLEPEDLDMICKEKVSLVESASYRPMSLPMSRRLWPETPSDYPTSEFARDPDSVTRIAF